MSGPLSIRSLFHSIFHGDDDSDYYVAINNKSSSGASSSVSSRGLSPFPITFDLKKTDEDGVKKTEATSESFCFYDDEDLQHETIKEVGVELPINIRNLN